MTEPVFKVIGNRFAGEHAEPKFWSVVMTDHAKNLECIDSGDTNGGGQALHEHLTHLRDTYEAIDSMIQTR